jgi:hypothetical protein
MNKKLTPTQLWINRQWWLAGIDLDVERQQARDEGRRMAEIDREIDRLMAVPLPKGVAGPLGGKRDAKWRADAWALMERIQHTPIRKDYPYVEPDDLPGIRKQRPQGAKLKPWKGSRKEFIQRVQGAWLGRVAGCMLGKPVEFWTRARIRLQAEATDNWPLKGYFRWPNAAQARRIKERDEKALFNPKLPHQVNSTLPGLNGACVDDDINYTVVGYALVKQYGATFSPNDVGAAWMGKFPLAFACTAERVAYRNFTACIVAPQSATFRNPYREWIGAQIRADYFGYANPGNPARAAEWAWRDACISHVRNGIYGEMWVAAMLAAAAVETNWATIIRAGLAQIPKNCRLREAIDRILAQHEAGLSYEQAVDALHARWDEKNFHHWCHTLSNAEVVTLALLWGGNDFTQTIACAVMAGFDTDCNGATAGSLWGMANGPAGISKVWTGPLHDSFQSSVEGYQHYSISKLAAEMVDLALKHRP